MIGSKATNYHRQRDCSAHMSTRPRGDLSAQKVNKEPTHSRLEGLKRLENGQICRYWLEGLQVHSDCRHRWRDCSAHVSTRMTEALSAQKIEKENTHSLLERLQRPENEHFWMILTTNKLIRAEARLVEPGRGNACTAAIMNSLGSNPPLHIRIPSARAALEPSSFWPSISQLR